MARLHRLTGAARYARRSSTPSKLVKKGSTAAHLAISNPDKLLRRARHYRRLLSGQERNLAPSLPKKSPRSLARGPSSTYLGVTFTQTVERGHLILQRNRGYDEGDYVVALELLDADDSVVKPGRHWRYSRSLESYFRNLPTCDEVTVDVEWSAGEGAPRRLRVGLIRRRQDASPPKETFGRAWSVHAAVRTTGAEPERIYFQELQRE